MAALLKNKEELFTTEALLISIAKMTQPKNRSHPNTFSRPGQENLNRLFIQHEKLFTWSFQAGCKNLLKTTFLTLSTFLNILKFEEQFRNLLFYLRPGSLLVTENTHQGFTK
jgi:hypothetical protein